MDSLCLPILFPVEPSLIVVFTEVGLFTFLGAECDISGFLERRDINCPTFDADFVNHISEEYAPRSPLMVNELLPIFEVHLHQTDSREIS